MVQSAYLHSCFRCLALGRYHTVAAAVTPVRAPRRCEPKKKTTRRWLFAPPEDCPCALFPVE